MDRKVLSVSAGIIISAAILVVVMGTSELPYSQSSVLKYSINTDCQAYTAFLRGEITSDIDMSKINPELKPLLAELLTMDHVENYEKIQSQNPHCEDEFRKLNS